MINFKFKNYISRHQLWNPGGVFVRTYDAISGFSKRIPLPVIPLGQGSESLLGKKIIIVMYRASVSSNFLDLFIYREVKGRGADVKVVLCNGDGFPCDNIGGMSNAFNFRCLQCKAIQRLFGEHINAEDIIYVKPTSSSIGTPDVNSISSAKRFDMREDYDAELASRYQKIYLSLKQLLKSQGHIDLIFMSHGLYATWGAARDYCREHGIEYITWGRTYFRKMLAVVKNSTFNEGLLSYDQTQIASPNHNFEYKQLIESLGARVSSGVQNLDTINYYSYLKDGDSLEQQKSLFMSANGRLIVSVYLSIPWDGTVYGANEEFRTQRDLINCIVSFAKKMDDIFFVFRLHPRESEMPEKAEDHIKQAMQLQILNNIHIIPPLSKITSYELAKISSLNILYSGTLAIEFAVAEYPLIVCGKNLVSGIDSVCSIGKKSELQAVVALKKYDHLRTKSEKVLIGLRQISTVLYDDDLTDCANYKIDNFKPNSKLVKKIVDELFV